MFILSFQANQLPIMTKSMMRLAGIVFLLARASFGMAQTETLSGVVTDSQNQEPLAGVSVVIKGAITGVSTNDAGKFSLSTSRKFPLTLVFSYVGYKTREQVVGNSTSLTISLERGSVLGQEVVVSASRTPERILESPVSVERLGAVAVRESGAPSFYEALPNLKGVESSVQSLTFRSINTRGFNANGNVRFNQFVDGMDNQAPGLNFSVGNVVGIADIDVESVELLPGAASALYGAGGTNGTLLMASKNPFNYQGLSLTLKQGMNHVDGSQTDLSDYTDLSLRYAKAWKNKFAFKGTFSYLTAQDWSAQDYSNFDRASGIAKSGNRSSDPLYDGVNIYGDEPNAAYPSMLTVANAVQSQTRAGILTATSGSLDIVDVMNKSLPASATPTQIAGFIGGLPAALQSSVQTLVPFYFGLRNNQIPNQALTRTGYEEKYLVDYQSKSIKTSGAIHYKINERTEALFQANWGTGTSVYTGSDRYSLRGFNIGQYKIEVRSPDFFIRGYTTQERSGDAYNATLLGTYINEYSNPSSAWFPDYTGAFANAFSSGATEAQAHVAARQYADRNRALPGSAEFIKQKDKITSLTIGPAGGAKFNDKSNLYHAEGMYNFSGMLRQALDVQVGASFRQYDLRSDGTIFDDLDKKLTIKEYGSFLQAGKKLFSNKFKLTGAIRYDKNENFEGRFTPRISGVYTVTPNSNLRASYQTGFRNPTTQNQYIDLLVGGSSGVRLIGGLPALINKYDLNTNRGYTLTSVNRFKQTGQASDLQSYTFGKFKPESVQSYEIGYKALFQNKLLLDAYYYYNSYKNFLATLILLQPTSTPSPFNPLGSPRTISTVVNNPDKVSSQGAAVGLDYVAGKYNLTGNVSYNSINDNNSTLQSEFNTPKYRFSLGIGNRSLTKNLGANFSYRWQDAFMWSSTFAAGKVPAFGTLDGQFSYKVPVYRSTLKIGGSNLLNKYYRTSFGNPSVGAVYYVSLTFDQLLN